MCSNGSVTAPLNGHPPRGWTDDDVGGALAATIAAQAPTTGHHLKNWLGVVPNCFLNMVVKALGLS